MRLLLDTSAYSALVRGHPEVVRRVRGASRLLASPIVLGEILFGFRLGSREEENRRRLEEFLRGPYVELLEVTRTTAERFARIAAGLREKGRPIPLNDIWIAAQSMETGADLLSSDRHFREIDGLAWIPFDRAGGPS